MNRFIILLSLFFSTITVASAQPEKPFFQIFDVGDDTKSITIETSDSFKIRKWSGTQLMIDMSIRLGGGSMDLLGLIIFDNRYAYDLEKKDGKMVVRAKIMRRDLAKLKYLGNFCTEKVTTTIYLPDGFEMRGTNEFARKDGVFIASDRK